MTVFTQQSLFTRAADYFNQARTPRAEWRKLDDLSAQLAEFDLRCAAGDYDTAAALLTEIDFDYLNLWGHYRLSISLHETLKENLNSRILMIENLNGLGLAYWSIGNIQSAIATYEQALVLAEELNNRTLKSTLLGNLGLVYSDIGIIQKAIEYFDLGLDISIQTKNLRNESNLRANLGNIYVQLGDLKKAANYYEQSITITKKIGDRRGEGNVLGSLGNVHSAQGDTNKAIKYYEQALKIAQDIGDRRGQCNHFNNLGNAWRHLDNPIKAEGFYDNALKIAQEIGYRRGEGQSLTNLGRISLLSRNFAQAIDYFEQSLKIANEIGDKQGQAIVLCELGTSNIDKYKIALEYFEKALSIACEIQERQIEISTRNYLAKLFIDLGDNEKATEHYRKLILILDSKEKIQTTKNEPRLLRAFLCHSARDKNEARELSKKLNEHGYDVWIDEKKLMPGQHWELEIENAIDTSDVILICLSSQSVNSESYLHKEIKTALDRADNMPEGEIFIIPCRFDDFDKTKMPTRLRELHWVDLYTPEGLDKLETSLSYKARNLGITVRQS